MTNQRDHKAASWNTPIQAKSSQLVPRPFAVQAQENSSEPSSQEDLENASFEQNKFEAFGLQLKEQSGTITSVEQERVGVLQAKMDDFWAQKLDSGSRASHSLANNSFDPPNASASTLQPSQGYLASTIQPKLSIGQPGDKYEQEADRVAAQVVQQLHTSQESPQAEQSVQREAMPEEEEELQMKPSLQREAMPEEEEELQMKPSLQRQSSEEGVTATAELESAIQQSRGGGQPIADSIRQPIEQAFSADFSGVKVHTDSQSDQLNKSIQAKAFTTGQDIFFRQGAYDPGSRGGQELLAHELTHTLQQGAAPVQRKPQNRLNQAGLNQSVVQRAEAEVRDKFAQVDLTVAADILTSDAAIVGEMKTVLETTGKLVMVKDRPELAAKMAADKGITEVDAMQMIVSNQGRGFTGQDGTIYIQEGDVAAHDIVHETVHVCSAPGGKTKILSDFGESLNEGFTEFFTKEFCAKLNVADAVAYPDQVAFIRKLATKVGNAPLHTAYLQNAGMTALIDQIATIWEGNADKGVPKPNVAHGKNVEFIAKKFKDFSPENAVWLKFWDKIIFA